MKIANPILNPVSQYSIEVTTRIGCPVNCLKYCPQEVLTKKYGANKRLLDPRDFAKILSKIPSNVEIIFSGFCEPFANPRCLELIDLASRRGYIISLYTTLVGATKTDVEHLFKYKFKTFCLHLPDGEVMPFPQNPEYKHNVSAVLHKVGNVTTLAMTKDFKSNNRENVVREINVASKPFVFCYKFTNPAPVLLPNGDVYLCCNDLGLRHKIGNLLMPDDDYEAIVKRIRAGKGHFKLCNYCSYNTSILGYRFRVGKEQIRTSLSYLVNLKRRIRSS